MAAKRRGGRMVAAPSVMDMRQREGKSAIALPLHAIAVWWPLILSERNNATGTVRGGYECGHGLAEVLRHAEIVSVAEVELWAYRTAEIPGRRTHVFQTDDGDLPKCSKPLSQYPIFVTITNKYISIRKLGPSWNCHYIRFVTISDVTITDLYCS